MEIDRDELIEQQARFITYLAAERDRVMGIVRLEPKTCENVRCKLPGGVFDPGRVDQVYCSKKCQYAYYKKNPEAVPGFKGGGIDSAGYRVIRGQREHRLVMEKHIGRKLLTSEHVHHIDGNKSNNSLINLVIIPN